MTNSQIPIEEKTISHLFEQMRTGNISTFFHVLSEYFAQCDDSEDGSFDLEYVKSELLSFSIEIWQMKYREEKHFAKVDDYLDLVSKNFNNMASVKYKFKPLDQRWFLRDEFLNRV